MTDVLAHAQVSVPGRRLGRRWVHDNTSVPAAFEALTSSALPTRCLTFDSLVRLHSTLPTERFRSLRACDPFHPKVESSHACHPEVPGPPTEDDTTAKNEERVRARHVAIADAREQAE